MWLLSNVKWELTKLENVGVNKSIQELTSVKSLVVEIKFLVTSNKNFIFFETVIPGILKFYFM